MLDTVIDLSICLDNLLHNRHPLQCTLAETISYKAPTPMEISCTRLTSSEREQMHCVFTEGRPFISGHYALIDQVT